MCVSAFVYFVGLKESTSGRDDTRPIQAYYWLPLEWSGTVCTLIGCGPCSSQPKSVTLLLGWSHSMLLPVLVPRDQQEGSRASCPAGCLRASPCLTPPYLPPPNPPSGSLLDPLNPCPEKCITSSVRFTLEIRIYLKESFLMLSYIKVINREAVCWVSRPFCNIHFYYQFKTKQHMEKKKEGIFIINAGILMIILITVITVMMNITMPS